MSKKLYHVTESERMGNLAEIKKVLYPDESYESMLRAMKENLESARKKNHAPLVRLLEQDIPLVERLKESEISYERILMGALFF
jgi:hypothetical protein